MCILVSKYYGGRRIRPPAGGPGRRENVPPARFLARLPFESTLHKDPYQAKAPSTGWGRWIRSPAGRPPRGSDMPPACHSLPLGFESTLHKDPYQTQDPSSRMGLVFGGGRWIRTTEGIASRFTVCPLWPLGNSPIFSCRLSGGAGGRIRTPDLLITNQLLYLLSYTSVSVQPVSPLIIANTALFVNKYFSSF